MFKNFLDRESSKKNDTLTTFSPLFYLCAALMIGVVLYWILPFFRLEMFHSLHFFSSMGFILIAFFHLAPILAKNVHEDVFSEHFATLGNSFTNFLAAVGAKTLVLFKNYLIGLSVFNLTVFAISFMVWGTISPVSLYVFIIMLFFSLGAVSWGLIWGTRNFKNSVDCKNSTLRYTLLLALFSLFTYLTYYFKVYEIELLVWVVGSVCVIKTPKYVDSKHSLCWGLGIFFLFISAFDFTRISTVGVTDYLSKNESIVSYLYNDFDLTEIAQFSYKFDDDELFLQTRLFPNNYTICGFARPIGVFHINSYGELSSLRSSEKDSRFQICFKCFLWRLKIGKTLDVFVFCSLQVLGLVLSLILVRAKLIKLARG